MEKAIIIHASLSRPSPELLEKISNRLGGIEVVRIFRIQDATRDLAQLRDIQGIVDIILLVHPEEDALLIALIARFLVNAIEDGVLTIIAVGERQELLDVFLG